MPLRLRVFLSSVTNDFGPLRSKLASYLRRRSCDVVLQEDFPQSDVDTVLKLDGLLSSCHIVVHLVGHQTGSVPLKSTVAEFSGH